MRSQMMLLVVLASGCTSQVGGLGSSDAGLGGAGSTVVVTSGGSATGGVLGSSGGLAAGGSTSGGNATGGVLGSSGGLAVGGSTSGGSATGGTVLGTGGFVGGGGFQADAGDAAVATGGAGTGGLGTGGVSAVGGAGGSLAGQSSSGGTAGTRGDAGSGSCAFVGPCVRTFTNTYGGSLSVNKTSFFYDANNRLIREESDYNGDGTADYVVRYSYDEHGWLLERKSDGCGGDGSVTSCSWLSYTYDAQGNILTLNDRSFYSGRAAGCTAFTYDSGGHLLKSEFSGRCSGTVQEVAVYKYDSSWRLISETWEYNGTLGSSTTYQYDAAGMLVSEARGADEIVTYTRNAAGLPLVEEHRMAAGSLGDNYRIIRTYDSAGNQLTERTKYLTGVSVGTDEFCSTNTYDQCGNMLTSESRNYCDQPGGSETTYSYECFAP